MRCHSLTVSDALCMCGRLCGPLAAQPRTTAKFNGRTCELRTAQLRIFVALAKPHNAMLKYLDFVPESVATSRWVNEVF
eukprot:6212987-Pleurochrysis_carterae.AAC.1